MRRIYFLESYIDPEGIRRDAYGRSEVDIRATQEKDVRQRTSKRCARCDILLPLTAFATYKQTCKVCVREISLTCKRCGEIGHAYRDCLNRGKNNGKRCTRCEGMSWRVIGIRCKCGLEYADEDPVTLEECARTNWQDI